MDLLHDDEAEWSAGSGIMEIRLEQDGDELVGEGGQLKHPFDPPATIRPIGTRSATVSDFIGQFKKARRHTWS